MDTKLKNQENNGFIKTHQPCEDCGSSDGLSINADGSTHCFVCNEHKLNVLNPYRPKKPIVHQSKTFLPLDGKVEPLGDRLVHQETCRKFDYRVGADHDGYYHVANYRDDHGNLIGQKVRRANKDFSIRGAITNRFYGQHLWKNGGNKLVIVEGEIDALVMSQVQKNSWPTVSAPNGAKGAAKTFKAQLKWLDKFDEIILMFDGDEAGREAVKECIRILPPGKGFVIELPEGKDPSDLLLEGKTSTLLEGIFNAKRWKPPHIIDASDLEDEIKNIKTVESAAYPFEGLNKKTLGIRKGEIVTLAAGSGVGKSQVCRTIAHNLLTDQNKKIAYIALEENNIQTAQSIIGIEMGKVLHSTENTEHEADFEKAWKNTLGKRNQFYLYDHWGSMDTESLLSDIRYLVQSLEVDVVFVDHVSIVISGMSEVEIGNERKAIDILMTQLRTLVEESKFSLILVSHLRRAEGNRGYEDGLMPNLSALRGSASLAQLSDIVLSLSRNLMSEERHVTTVSCLKNRFTGDTGICCFLRYDPETGRLQEQSTDLNELN